jgi:hypothetical protein
MTVPDVRGIDDWIVGVGQLGKFGRGVSFHVKLSVTKSLHQQIIIGILRARTGVFKKAPFGAAGKDGNHERASDPENSKIPPLDVSSPKS